jgi:predicted ATPase/DNA-binding CsgD family transcriptional regulator
VGAAVAAAADMHGFAPALTSFVGRDGEVAQVAGLLGEYRLVTVTGPGGIGKTRLASEVARLVAARFADGAWLVELAGVPDPAQVASAVAARLGVPPAPGLSVPEALAAVLGRQQLLLVLDNCEHVLAEVASLCQAVLPAADDVRVLATSREPLGLPGEVRFRLGPLPVRAPDTQFPEPAMGAAVRLFSDRARQADPGFVLDGESGPAVTALVDRLDGSPLAIELAAARVDTLGLAQLAGRLERSLPLLVSADRTAPGRHQSLAATVGWSYRLLDPEGQRVFRWLAVFPGPFTLDAAAAVAGAGSEAAVLHLVDCSLLSPPRPGPDDQTRYLMTETVRMSGATRLAEAGEQDEAAAGLARYALAVAEQAAADTRTREEVAAFRRLDAEDATVMQAVAWAREHNPETMLRLAVALAEWLLLRGREDQARELLLEASGQASPGTTQWCRAQFWLGDLGPPAESVRYETAACEALADQASPLMAEVLAGRSRTLKYLGRLPEAARDARQALQVARQAGYPAGEILALAQLSHAARHAGDAAAVLDWARQGQQILASGDYGWTQRFTGQFMTEVMIEAGDLAGARKSLRDRLAWVRASGDRLEESSILTRLADLDMGEGSFEDAARDLRQATGIIMAIGWRGRLVRLLDLWAHLLAARGQPAEAVTIWAAFTAGLETDPSSADPPSREKQRREPLNRAVAALGPARAQAARERGAAMTPVTAAEFALLTADTEPEAPAPGLSQLSHREQELVGLVAKGQTDAQIASQLYIAVSTVRSHLDRIRDKTGSRRRADLTRLALQAGLI